MALFWLRHRKLRRFINRRDPGFWPEWQKLITQDDFYRYYAGNCLPQRPTYRKVQTRRKELRIVAIQTEETMRCQATQALPVPGERKMMSPREAREERTNRSGCWNCTAEWHFYAKCPLPRQRKFCYGCEEQGVTLRECQRIERHNHSPPLRGPRTSTRAAANQDNHEGESLLPKMAPVLPLPLPLPCSPQ
ncbi:uncharacterized protein [Temnothorax longispinosus]|uniref:uncharacterized protein n=1 Tax=Temnothorax longispinosus TaxID=300112 RepID=UPI003A99C319